MLLGLDCCCGLPPNDCESQHDYTDSFSTMDSEWTQDPADTWEIVSATLQSKKITGSDYQHEIERCATFDMTGGIFDGRRFYVEIEIVDWSTNLDWLQLYVSVPLIPIVNAYLKLEWDAGASVYKYTSSGGDLSSTPAVNDVIRLELDYDRGTPAWHIQYKVNGTTEQNTWWWAVSFVDPFYYGLQTYSTTETTSRCATFDNLEYDSWYLVHYLDADGTIGANVVHDLGSGGTYYTHCRDFPTYGSSDWIANDQSETSTSAWFSLTNTVNDFDTLTSLNLEVDVEATGFSDDTCTLTARVYDADNDTTNPLTDSQQIASDADGRTQRTVTFGSLTGTKTDWNNAHVKFTWAYTQTGGGDNGQIKLYGCKFYGAYTA